MRDLIKIPNQPISDGLLDFEQIVKTRESLSLRDYQAKHLGFYLSQKRSLSLEEAGVGKTIPACLWAYTKSKDDRVIWAMPKSLLVKNYEELLLWSNLEPHQIMLIDGSPVQRKKQMDNSDARVFLMGFTAFADNWPYLRERYPNCVHLVVDELHMGFSNHGAQDYRNADKYWGTARTAKMYEYMKKGGDYLGMTGTFIAGRLTSAYPSISLINPLYYGTFDNFIHWHAILDDYGKPFMWKNHERLQQIIDTHSRSYTYEQAYGKENKEVFVEYCTMGKKQFQAYQEMEQRGIVELDDMMLEDSENPGVNLLRCFEIMQTPEKYGLPINKVDGKEAHLSNHFEEAKMNGTSIIVFEVRVGAHQKIAELVRKTGLNAGIMNGNVIGAARTRIDVAFRSGRLDVLVCSPEVAGVGFNWGHCDLIIFNSLDFQDTTFTQNIRRAMRGVRDKVLRIIVLEYRKSIDRRIQMGIYRKSVDRAKVERTPVIFFKRPGGEESSERPSMMS